jgi:phage tail-like protein
MPAAAGPIVTPLGASYIDLVALAALGVRPLLVNRVPEPDEIDVPPGFGPSYPVEFVLVDPGAAGLDVTKTKVWIRFAAAVGALPAEELVYDGGAGGFTANWVAASAHIAAMSPGSAVTDEEFFQLVKAVPFVSLDRVELRVQAETLDAETLDELYHFTITDLTTPELISARTVGLRRLELAFSEPVAMVGARSALRVREISGRITTLAPSSFEAEGANFTAGDVGGFIAAARADNAVNNGYLEIMALNSTNKVTVLEQGLRAEGPSTTSKAWVGPYRLQATIEPERVVPSFTPAIIAAEQVAPDVVVLTLEQDLSPGRPYTIEVRDFEDVADPPNQTPTSMVAFVAEPLPRRAGRRFSVLDFVPRQNFREDSSRDMERVLRILDETLQFMLYDSDQFENLIDIDKARDDVLDVLLAHLGNPFTFLGNDADLKRRTLDFLVAIYKDGGIERCIEASVLFFLGIPVDVRRWNNPDDSWILGESELGVDTILATSISFLRFSFEVVSPVTLTERQRDIIREIALKCKPAHTHFVRFLEPGGPVPAADFGYWELGTKALGESTVLGP